MPMSVPSSRVAGEVLTVAAKDFQRIKAGDLLVQIDPAVSLFKPAEIVDNRRTIDPAKETHIRVQRKFRRSLV